MTATAQPGKPVQPEYPRNQAKDISEVEPYRRRFADMRADAESFRQHWAEIEEWEFPRRGRWLRDVELPVGARIESKVYSDRIINDVCMAAREVVTAGLQDGLTPSTEEWIVPRPVNEELRDDAEVTWYLSRLRKRIAQILGDTNFYAEVAGFYEDATAFGTTCMLSEETEDVQLVFTRLPVGSFWLEADAQNRVSGMARRYVMGAESMLAEFGRDKLPKRVTDRLERGHYYDRETLIQCIRPVDPDDRGAPEWATYESVFFLDKKADGEDRLLARRYYRVRPFIAFRWVTDDGVPYGTRCPGMSALGSVRQLQAMERKKLKALDHSIDPPLLVNSDLRGKLNRRSGGVTFVDGGNIGESVARPLLQVNYGINDISAEVERIQNRIEQAHYNRFFLSALLPTKQMTAEEIKRREEERMMVLGPLIERSGCDILIPLAERIVDFIMFNQLAPPPPEQMGANVKYEFSGKLALIREAAKISGIQQWMAFMGNAAAMTQSAAGIDRIDMDEMAEVTARVLNVDEVLLVPQKEAEKRRAEAAQAQAAQAQVAAMPGLAGAAKDLSQAAPAMAAEGAA